MLLLRRFTPFLCAGTLGALFAFLIWRPAWLLKLLQTQSLSWAHVLTVFLLSLLVIVLGLFIIGGGEQITSRYRFALFPVLLTGSAFTVLLYSEYPPAHTALLVAVPALVGLWFEILYYFWQRPDLYHPYSLQKVASYLYLIEIFLLISALAGVQTLVQVPSWITTLISTVLLCLIQLDLLKLHQFDSLKAFVFSLFGTILAVELLVALNLLPTHFFMSGAIVALFFYAWVGIGKQFLQKEVDKPQVVAHIVVATLGSLMTIVSSFWFT